MTIAIQITFHPKLDFPFYHCVSIMPSPTNERALDIQQKDARQALAEDKYDDCTACRVTGSSLGINLE